MIAERCATAPKSMASCTLEDANNANPVWRHAITSDCSALMEMAWVATFLEATWITPGFNWPAIRYMVGIINIRPWDAV